MKEWVKMAVSVPKTIMSAKKFSVVSGFVSG